MTHSPSPIPARLASLRQALVRHDLAAVLVPSSDPHLSEYLPERWQGRVHFSGFTGSMGTLVVTRDRAAVFAADIAVGFEIALQHFIGRDAFFTAPGQ